MTEYTVTMTVECEVTVTVEAAKPTTAASRAQKAVDNGALALGSVPGVELSDYSTNQVSIEEMYDDEGEAVEWDD